MDNAMLSACLCSQVEDEHPRRTDPRFLPLSPLHPGHSISSSVCRTGSIPIPTAYQQSHYPYTIAGPRLQVKWKPCRIHPRLAFSALPCLCSWVLDAARRVDGFSFGSRREYVPSSIATSPSRSSLPQTPCQRQLPPPPQIVRTRSSSPVARFLHPCLRHWTRRRLYRCRTWTPRRPRRKGQRSVRGQPPRSPTVGQPSRHYAKCRCCPTATTAPSELAKSSCLERPPSFSALSVQ
ncbi:hypothetical protein LXA43DRAFT_137759 [Ganoderma leucocontextum]|nr:hypothetical protein LXA43DRAFT_137759 [Ganoderma leucocontextum]